MNLPEGSRPQIFPFESSFQKQVVALAREILCDELQLVADLSAEEDLADVGKSYAPPQNCFLLALVEGRLVATGAIRHLSGTDCELRRLLVSAGHRRMGLASAIVAELIPFVNERGYKRIWLEIRPDMAALSHVYERYGFAEATDTSPRPGRFMSIRL